LDDLPPSKFVLDEWKRVYSNTKEIRKVAAPWLWANFDNAGYSMWIAEYKFNSELQKLFMTCNLIGGFVQRLDAVRKYGFGTVLIFGEEPKLEVGAFFLFRGPDVPQVMRDVEDTELYNWTKVDVNNEQHRELVNDYLSWDGKFGGRAISSVNQGKTFK